MNNKESTVNNIKAKLTGEQHRLLLAVLEAAITNDKTHYYTEQGVAQLTAIKEQLQ